MKKYLLISAVALALGACVGNSGKDMTAEDAASPEVLLEQAQQAYESGDKATAISKLRMAAQADNVNAQYTLARAYLAGDGVAKDEQQSLQWLAKAAEQGFAPAQNDLGGYYLDQKDIANAAPLLQAAAEQGYAPAQFNFGVMLVRGDGVQKNEEAGVALIQQSAAQGFPPAQQALQQAQ